MQAYKNINGNSGIAEFEIGETFIKVKFNDGDGYLYTYASAGVNNIEEMKKFAQNGCGLNTYINKYVRKKYESKF